MTDDRIDLWRLEPPDHEALVRAISARTATVLAERRARAATIQIGAWWRPVAAAAFLVAMASALVLTLEPRSEQSNAFAGAPPGTRRPSARTELARELGVPPALALSLTRDTPPSALEFLREASR